MVDSIEKPVNPKQWRGLLAETVGSSWTFGSEAIRPTGNPKNLDIHKLGRQSGSVNAYYSAPMLQHQADELAAKLAAFGISPIEAESQGGDKRRIVVMESELQQHGDALVASRNARTR